MTEPLVDPPAAVDQPAPRTNTLAVVSLVSSIAGLLTAGLTFIVGVITGHIALSQIKRTREDGRGLALAGVIVGYVGIGLSVLFLIGLIALIIFAGSLGFDMQHWRYDVYEPGVEL